MAATRKITNRAFSVLLIAAMVVCGMGVYLVRYIEDGKVKITKAGEAAEIVLDPDKDRGIEENI